jgi:hypothetical protein
MTVFMVTHSEEVKSQCNTNFSYDVDSGYVVKFIPDTITTGVYRWDFGDGNSSLNVNAVHRYELPQGQDTGSFRVTLTQIGERCVDSTSQIIRLGKTCESSFSSLVLPNKIQFINRSDFRDSSEWLINGKRYVNKDTIYFDYTPSLKDQYVNAELRSFSSGWDCSKLVRDSILVPANPCYSFFELAVDTTKPFTLYLINRSFDLPGHTYQWYFGDSIRSTDRNPTYTFKEFGRYTICLGIINDVDSCGEEYCMEIGLDKDGKLLKQDGFTVIVIDAPLSSIEDKTPSDARLYPNPVQTELNYENAEWDTYSIFSFDGSEVLQGNLQYGKGSIDVSVLKAGLFFIRFANENHTSVQRIIKN